MANDYTPKYITLKGMDENDPEYPEVNITDKARIPVIALSYSDKDIAKEKELLLDYEKGGLYVVDANDRTIIHDLSKLIADNYLSNIDGNNTYVNIEGIGVVNLATILKLLYDSRIELVNSVDDSMAIPSEVSFDNASVTVANNKVEVYGFHNALPLSTPRVSEDGSRIEWVGGVEENKVGGDLDKVDDPPGGYEPPLGAKQNVVYIYPKDATIILYNKPQQFTAINEVVYDSYNIKFPLTMMQYAKFYWRLDTEVAVNLKWQGNLTWLNPRPNNTAPNNIYIFECQTWDYGNTWIVKYINYEYILQDITGLLPDGIYFTDENGNLLTNLDSTYYTGEQVSDNPNVKIRSDNPTDGDETEYTTQAIIKEDGDQSGKVTIVGHKKKDSE